MRMGIVLDRDTPALDRLVSLARWGLGGRIGSGRQWISWLHIADLLSVVKRVIADAAISGMIHVTSPSPVRNAELMAALRRVLNRPAAPPTPAVLVHIGAILLRTDPALALTGRRCIPRRLLELGFQFGYPELLPALEDLFRGDRPSQVDN
jgi:NAD dependent epimerase/dehydratase family enzyme